MPDKNDPFPLQAKNTFDDRPATVPRWIAELAITEHQRQNGGTLHTVEDYARRGGFGAYEIAKLLADRIRRLEAGEK